MGDVQIGRVETSAHTKEFIDLPFRLYREDPHWAAPLKIAVKELLDRKKHPFYATSEMDCFLARRDGRVVGRIAAVYNRAHNKFHNEEAGFWGFFECENDPEAAAALFAAVKDYLAPRNVKVIYGPVNPSTNYECGLLVDGFDSGPMVMMTYNPPYYATLLDGLGLRKTQDLFAYLTSPYEVAGSKAKRIAEKAMKRQGVTVRPINMKDFANDVEKVWHVYALAWERNWGFVPMSKEEFVLMGKEMKQILKPEFVLIGEVQGRVVGFALALPDINQALKPARGKLLPFGLLKILYYQRLIKDLRVIALGVVEEYRATGVAAGFYAALIDAAARHGYQKCELSWILEDNVLMNRSLETLGAKRYKTYRIYEWN